MALQFCTFHVGELLLGLEVEQIQEVLRNTKVTPVPKTPLAVSGLINLRGQIVTAVDLRTLFGYEKEEDNGDGSVMLIVESDAELHSLVVDAVGDVVEVEETAFEDPPDTLKGESRKLIRGAYKLKDGLLLSLDESYAMTAAAKNSS